MREYSLGTLIDIDRDRAHPPTRRVRRAQVRNAAHLHAGDQGTPRVGRGNTTNASIASGPDRALAHHRVAPGRTAADPTGHRSPSRRAACGSSARFHQSSSATPRSKGTTGCSRKRPRPPRSGGMSVVPPAIVPSSADEAARRILARDGNSPWRTLCAMPRNGRGGDAGARHRAPPTGARRSPRSCPGAPTRCRHRQEASASSSAPRTARQPSRPLRAAACARTHR